MKSKGKELVLSCAFLAVMVTAGLAVAASEAESGGPILSGCELDYPPYCIVTPDGKAEGFSVELLSAALKSVGREVVFKTAEWSVIKQDLAEGRLQALPLVGRTPEREALYDFTFPYLTMHGTIVVREDNADIRIPRDLKGKRVAAVKGENAEEYLLRAKLGAVIISLPSFEIALRELSEGKHDAVVIQKLVALQLMQKTGLKNLRIVGPPIRDFTQSFCFAARKGDSAMLALLNEGLSIVMADGTFRQLYAKWFSALESSKVARRRIMVGGDSNYPPYEFLDRNGQPTGLNVDLTRAIARRMGLTVDVKLGPWSTIRKGLEAGEIDVVEGMFYSAERDRAYDFTPPYLVVHHGIVIRKDSPELADMKELAGKSILVMAGDIMEDLAVKQGYGKQLVAVPSQEEALRLLAEGRGDCALVAKIPALYWIRKNKWHNLRLSGQTVLPSESCYAVTHGRSELLSQWAEGIAEIKATGEYQEILSRWLSPYETTDSRWRTIGQVALAGVLILLLLLGGGFLWSRSLQRQVAARTSELSLNNALLAAQSEASPDGILIVQDNALILSYNRRFVEMWELPPEMVRERRDEPVLRFVAGKVLDECQFIARVYEINRQSSESSRDEIVLKDGRYFERYSAPICDAAGRYYGRVWYFHDMTERKRGEKRIEAALAETRRLLDQAELSRRALLEAMEEQKRTEAERERLQSQLIQAQKMESVGRLAGGVAHDFNNMLQAILGYLEMAMAQVDPSAKLHGDLVEIRNAALRSAELTGQLLAFARKQTIIPKVLDLNETVEGMLKMLRRLIGEDIELAWFPGAGSLTVKMDPSQVDQILANLCVNARDAISGVGKITIETQFLVLNETFCASHAGLVPGSYVMLGISDTGCGMDPAQLEKIFEPFFTTKGVGEGTGLGLSTVYGIVNQNKGHIDVSSERGKGSRFLIYLPAHARQGEVGRDAAVTCPGGTETILLVEDENAIRHVLRRQLEDLGYSVLSAESADAALDLAAAHSSAIHLLITDVVMPKMSGKDLAKRLTSQYPGMKCIFISGYPSNFVAPDGVLDEGTAFVSKPFSGDLLARKVREVLGARQAGGGTLGTA